METIKTTKTMKTITHNQLVAMLAGTPGATFAGIVANTDARLLKTGNPLALPVFKTTVATVTTGASYGNAVNREALRQGGEAEFVTGSLPKGRNWLVANKVLVSDDGAKLYLRTEYTPGERKQRKAKVLCYRDANGQYVDKTTVEKFTPSKGESVKQQTQTGIVQTVQVRDWLFTSIVKIRLNGQTYRLVK